MSGLVRVGGSTEYKRRPLDVRALSLPDTIINVIFTCLRAQEMALFSSTEKRIYIEAKKVIVKRWSALGVNFPPNQKYEELVFYTRIYFKSLLRDMMSYTLPVSRAISHIYTVISNDNSEDAILLKTSVSRQLKILEDLKKEYISNYSLFCVLNQIFTVRSWAKVFNYLSMMSPISQGPFFQLIKTYTLPQRNSQETISLGHQNLKHVLEEFNHTFQIDRDVLRALFQNGVDPYFENPNPFFLFFKKIIETNLAVYNYELLESVMDLVFEQEADMDQTKGDKTGFKFAYISLQTASYFLDECEDAEIQVRKTVKTLKYLLEKNPDYWNMKFTDTRQNALDEVISFEMSVLEVFQEVLSSVRDHEKYNDITENMKEIIRRYTFESNRESAHAVLF